MVGAAVAGAAVDAGVAGAVVVGVGLFGRGLFVPELVVVAACVVAGEFGSGDVDGAVVDGVEGAGAAGSLPEGSDAGDDPSTGSVSASPESLTVNAPWGRSSSGSGTSAGAGCSSTVFGTKVDAGSETVVSVEAWSAALALAGSSNARASVGASVATACSAFPPPSEVDTKYPATNAKSKAPPMRNHVKFFFGAPFASRTGLSISA